MNALLRYLAGYVRVRLSGYATERFLNLSTNHGMYIWGMEHHDDTYEFFISLKDFYKIRPLVRKTRTRIRIVKRCGFPFFLHRYRKRKLFLPGFLIGIGIIYAFSSYIWKIEICGNSVLSEDTILRYLQEQKIQVGVTKKEIDCEELEAELRAYFPNVIWTSVRLEGTKLTVDIKENLVTKEPDKDTAAKKTAKDIVADKDAVILDIITRNGTPKVKAGDKVKKGRILVSGRIDIRNDAKEIKDYEYCKADADILAQTSYLYKYTIPKRIHKKVYTQKEKTHYSIGYQKKYIGLFHRKISYRLYEKETEKTQIKIMDNFYLPFFIQKDTYKEYQMKDYELTKKEAKQLAIKDLSLFLLKLKEKGLQITEKNVIMDTEKNNYLFQGTIITEEKFGVYKDTKILQVPKKEGTIENELE